MKNFRLLVIFIFCGKLTCSAHEKKNIDSDFGMKMVIYKEQKVTAKKMNENLFAKNYPNCLNAKPEK